MNRKKIEFNVVSIISSILKCDVNPNSTRDELEDWDSLKHIEIVFTLEDALGIQFSEEIIPTLDSIPKIIAAAEELNAS